MRRVTRRGFVGSVGAGMTAIAVGGGFGARAAGAQQADSVEGGKGGERVRDRFWLWGHPSGSHDAEWNLPKPSRITPVEAAFYMGIPNVIMVKYNGQPNVLDITTAIPFRSLREVVWSAVGAGGTWQSDETAQVLELPKYLPNMTGVMMDDFFKEGKTAEEVGQLSPTDVSTLRTNLAGSGKGLKLWVVLYDGQLELPVTEHLKLCDVVTFWTWEAGNLAKLEENFKRFERVVPENCGKVLGCYMWDYGKKQPMPVDAMQHQCELGLRWLRVGRIEG